MSFNASNTKKKSKTLENNIKINKNSQYINFVGNIIKKKVTYVTGTSWGYQNYINGVSSSNPYNLLTNHQQLLIVCVIRPKICEFTQNM